MSLKINRLWILMVITAMTLLTTDVAQAQCSRGSQGGGPSLSARSADWFNRFSSLANSRNSFASQRQLAYQEQVTSQQRMAFAARQRQAQQLADARLAKQQELQATRLARAAATRAKRAQRIAALRAKMGTEVSNVDSGIMLTSTATGTNPFDRSNR